MFRQISQPYLCSWGLEFCRMNCVWCDFFFFFSPLSAPLSQSMVVKLRMPVMIAVISLWLISLTSSRGPFLSYPCAGSLQAKWPHLEKGMDVPGWGTEILWQTHPMPGQRGKGTQLGVLEVGPFPRFCPSGVSCSSVKLGIAAWKSLLAVGYFLTLEEEHPVIFRASSDSDVSQLTGWNAYSDLEKLGFTPFSITKGLFQEMRALSCLL